MTPVALVTGASRGLGRATALALAAGGFDVALTARTVHEGEGLAAANSVRAESVAVAVPGSLERTAEEIVALGRRALPVPADLLDVDALLAVPDRVLAEWGRIDVLVNNAIFQGVGAMDRFLDLTAESMGNLVTGNYINQVLLIQRVLPGMLERRSGRIINMVSGSARRDPPGPPGEGGWGIGYAASKAAFGRVAGGIEAEFARRGVRAFNVDPGDVATETRRARHPGADFSSPHFAPPEATANVIAWLATSDAALAHAGRWVVAPTLAAELGVG